MAGHIVSNGLPLRRVRYDASYKDRITFLDLCLLRRWQGIKYQDSIRYRVIPEWRERDFRWKAVWKHR